MILSNGGDIQKMSATKKGFDIEKVLANAVTVDKIPPISHRGKKRIDFLPLIKIVQQKGIVRLSEKDVNVISTSHGLLEQAKTLGIKLCANTRKIDGVIYLYLSKGK